MKCLQLMFMCWCSSIRTVTSRFVTTVNLSGQALLVSGDCVTAYWRAVTCVLNITDNPVGSSNYTLKFTDIVYEKKDYSCPLVMNHSYSCVCEVTDFELGQYDKHLIELCDESRCNTVVQEFKPSDNIQLTPPNNVEVQETPEVFNISWNSGYRDHMYLEDDIFYDLLLQTSEESKALQSNQRDSISVERSALKPGATYCFKVRSKAGGEYKGIWSEWSQPACWKNRAEEEQDNKLVILVKFLGPVFAVFGVLLFVCYGPTARMKIKTLSHTPSPAPFFQPLFQQHKGNLQEWLTPKGKFVLTYKPEEILMADTLIVMPKPVAKGPEENQDLHNPSVQSFNPQLTFTQCQTSYVGLPGIHEVSPPLTMISAPETSYTQLPCPVWGVGPEEAEVVPSAPKDLFNISHTDSGCSCEDLSQISECSEPTSPVVDNPPPCYCTDYCILNKTAEGFTPVLVSKGSSLNI